MSAPLVSSDDSGERPVLPDIRNLAFTCCTLVLGHSLVLGRSLDVCVELVMHVYVLMYCALYAPTVSGGEEAQGYIYW